RLAGERSEGSLQVIGTWVVGADDDADEHCRRNLCLGQGDGPVISCRGGWEWGRARLPEVRFQFDNAFCGSVPCPHDETAAVRPARAGEVPVSGVRTPPVEMSLRPLRVAILTTDNRENDRDYGVPRPYFGTAPAALLEGFQQTPEVEI